MKRKERNVTLSAVPNAVEGPARPLCWESFFLDQPSPVLRSQILTALMAGTSLQQERIPKAALLDAVLIAFAARTYCEAEVVDDFRALCTRTEEAWRTPDWTTRVFSSMHANAANFIINHDTKEFAGVEEQYIPLMTRWYLDHDAPEYFAREVTVDEVTSADAAKKSPAKMKRVTESALARVAKKVGMPQKRGKAKKAMR